MEEVTDQIDRLNFALQQVIDGIGNTSIDRPARMSITSAKWMDDSEDSLDIPDNLEGKLESLIQEVDRANMLAEDLWSGYGRSHIKLSLTRSEIHSVIHQLQNLRSGQSCDLHIGKEVYSLSLDPTDFGIHRDLTIIENSIIDCGHDMMKLKKEIAMDVEKQLKAKKNQLIEEAKKNYEGLVVEFETIKEKYEEKLQECLAYSNQLEIREKNVELRELKIQKTMNSEVNEDLELKIKNLEKILKNNESVEMAKIELQIEQMKNKQMNLRVEKVINESKQTSSVLTRLTKAMEKEVSNDEKQRKKLLDKINKAQFTRSSEGVSSLKKQEENFKVYMEKTKNRIKKKEAELAEKEKMLEDKWMKASGSKELIDLARQSIDKLNFMKEENEQEREILEREKLDIVNWNEKIKRVWSSLEKLKLASDSDLASQIANLEIDPVALGFN